MKITNYTELTDALARIETLWLAPPGTREGAELDMLLAAVKEYEDVHYPL